MKTHPVPLRRHFLSAALLGLLLSVHAPAADQTATWNGTTGIWSDFTKWNTNPLFPNNGNGGFTFDAVQTTGTVTVDQAITIQKLTMSGGTNTGAGFTLTTNELFTFQGGATLNGTGTVQADGGVAFGTGNTTLSGGRTLNLGGNSTWSAGAIQFFDNSVLTNQAGSTFTTSFNGTMSGGSAGGTFNNAGTFTKSAGTLTTILVTANNTGTISVESGTVSLNAGGTHSGIFSPDAGATLRFGGGTHILEAGTSLTGSGTVQLSTGTLTLNSAVSTPSETTFALSGGTLNGAGTLTLNGPLNWTGGTMDGVGTVQANGGVAISVASNNKPLSGGRTLNLGGNSTWSGDIGGSGGTIQFFDNSVLNNQAGVTFTTSQDSGMSGGSAGGTFNNAGTFTKSAGTLTTILVTANNTGTISVESGTVTLNAGGTHSGFFSPGTGATLRFGGGTHILEAGTSFTGSGTVQLSAGTLTLNSAVSSAADTTFTLSAGTLNGPGALTLNGPLNWTGGSMDGVSTVQANGNATFSGGNRNLSGGRTLNLGGSTDWTAGVIQFSDNSVLTNQAGATLTTNFNGSLSGGSAEGTFNNAGTFTKSGGTGTTTIAITANNTGTISVDSGTLSFSSTSVVTQHVGTTLTGGTWNVSNGASINIATGSNITTIGSAASVTLDGAGSSFAKVTTALNNNQGNFTLKNNRDLTTAGAFTNSGTVTVQDSTTTMTIGAGGSASYTQTAGNTVLVNGAMIDASAFNLNGGTLSGNGTIDSGLTTSGSTIIGPGASPGALTINGNTILGAGNTLAMEIGGLTPGIEHDLITVNGTLTLDGALMIKFFGGYETALTMGSTFEIVTSNAPVQSMFSNVASGSQIWDFDHHHLFEVWYGASSMFGTNNVVLFALTPEPSRGILLLAGAFSFILRRRRK